MSNPITPSSQHIETTNTVAPVPQPILYNIISLSSGFTLGPLLIVVGEDTDSIPALAAGIAFSAIGGLSTLFLAYQACKENKSAENTALLENGLRLKQLPKDSHERVTTAPEEHLKYHRLA